MTISEEVDFFCVYKQAYFILQSKNILYRKLNPFIPWRTGWQFLNPKSFLNCTLFWRDMEMWLPRQAFAIMANHCFHMEMIVL